MHGGAWRRDTKSYFVEIPLNPSPFGTASVRVESLSEKSFWMHNKSPQF